jgi:hypothetical protein
MKLRWRQPDDYVTKGITRDILAAFSTGLKLVRTVTGGIDVEWVCADVHDAVGSRVQ